MTPAVALCPPSLPRPAAPAAARVSAPYTLGFVLFLLVNAALFVRPAEIVPDLVGWNIYEILILACFALSFPAVLEQFSSKSLEERPVTVCVLGLFLAVVLSFLAQVDFANVFSQGVDFAKMVLYYVLFVGLVNTSARLRTFLFWMLVFATTTIALAVLQYHGYITLPNLNQTIDGAKDAATGADKHIIRLCGSGIFHDPNELGVLISVSVVLGLYWASDLSSGPARLLWLAPLALFFYAMSLTQSRGALLALLAGLTVFLVSRHGWRTALLLGVFLVPALFMSLGDRQTDLSTQEGTAQDRIQIWSDAVMTMRQAPLFGVGREVFAKQEGLVAHNSYLQCFVELGAFGGMLFLGAFYLATEPLLRLGDRRKYVVADPEMSRLYPYVLGVVVSWAVGMLSLTLCYILPTYTILALATAYTRMVRSDPPLPTTRFDLRLLGRLLAVAVGGFAILYLFVRLFTVR